MHSLAVHIRCCPSASFARGGTLLSTVGTSCYVNHFVAGMQTGLMPAQSREPAKDNRTDKVSRHILAPKKELTVRREDAFITFFPEKTQRLTYGLDETREAPIIGKQWFSWAPSEDLHYRWGIAPARTYAPSLQVCFLPPGMLAFPYKVCMFFPAKYPYFSTPDYLP